MVLVSFMRACTYRSAIGHISRTSNPVLQPPLTCVAQARRSFASGAAVAQQIPSFTAIRGRSNIVALLHQLPLRSWTASNFSARLASTQSVKNTTEENVASASTAAGDLPAKQASTASESDIDMTVYKDQNATWLDRHAPTSMLPYLKLTRLDRPIGTWLVLLPGWWGLALAAAPGHLPDLSLVAVFGAGAFLMRSAGCTINDMWDRDFDKSVARTRLRPLASNRLTLFQALCFLALQLSAGLYLLLQLNWPTIQLGVLAVPLVAVYPLMKRFTNWPQAVLGLAMNYGILMGATAKLAIGGPAVDWHSLVTIASQSGLGAAATSVVSHLTTLPLDVSSLVSASLSSGFLPLYGGAALWTIVYDTVYAFQDTSDDRRLGLKSTALHMGQKHALKILGGFSLAAGGLWLCAGYNADLSWPYFGAVAAATTHMLWQVTTADFTCADRHNLARRFVSNKWVGWIMLAGIVGGKLVQ